MTPAIRVGATGFGLIAVCYGFARFAFGLFLPQMRADLEFSSTLPGGISGGAFAAYCVAIIISARLSERFGPRAVAVCAAVIAAAGLFGIALCSSSAWLAFFVILAGTSTGLASPPMADAVSHAVAPARRDLTNTIINAGTSARVGLSGPFALALGDDWRLVFMIFAGTASALGMAAFVALPAAKTGGARTRGQGLPRLNPNLARLIAAAFLMGTASTALWSFGGEIAQARLDWSTGRIGMLWIAIGTAGIVGASAGWLTTRLGINTVHRIFLVALTASIAITGLSFTTPRLTLIGGALFGAAYVMLTGVYLVWGTKTLPNRPGTGLMVGFLTIAVGQTAGAPLFGLLMSQISLQTAVFVFAGLGLAPGLFLFRPAADSKIACRKRFG
jgi:predicted MFS family arabinose efflux permease